MVSTEVFSRWMVMFWSAMMGVAMAQPSIELKSLETDRVVLVPCDRFDALDLLHPRRNRQLDPMAPYSVVLRNDTDLTIVAYHIKWSTIGPDGKHSKGGESVYDIHISPHSYRLISLLRAFGTESRDGVDAAEVAEAASLDALFKSQTALTISLEAVVFEDGTAIGPDTDNRLVRWKAFQTAERDVFSTAAESPGTFRNTATSWITDAEADAAMYFNNKLRTEDALLLAATRHASSYEEIYKLAKGYKAWRVLQAFDIQGVDQALRELRQTLEASKQHVAIHRKGEQQ
jgi:hypothetical protein